MFAAPIMDKPVCCQRQQRLLLLSLVLFQLFLHSRCRSTQFHGFLCRFSHRNEQSVAIICGDLGKMAILMISAFPLMKLYERENCRRYVRSLISLYRLRFVKFTFPHITMIVENRIVRNLCCALLATFGIMSLMLFIWCFDSLLAPYPMNSFFLPIF
jgi:hypothetical protein